MPTQIRIATPIALIILICVTATPLRSQSLSVGADLDYAPFSFLESGQPAGFDIAFMKLVAEELGREVDFVLAPWAEIHDMARTGALDIVVGALYTSDRQRYLAFTVPYNVFRFVLAVRKDSDIQGISDLDGRRMAYLEEDAVPDLLLRREGIAPEFVSYPTLYGAVSGVASGDQDFVIAPREYLEKTLTNGYSDTMRIIENEVLVASYRMGVTGTNAELVADLNRVIDGLLDSNAYNELSQRWLGRSRDPFSLDTQEQTRPAVTILIILGVMIIVAVALFQWIRLRSKGEPTSSGR